MKKEKSGSTAGAKRIVLVEDHALMRLGLKQLIEDQSDFTVCGEASTVRDALDLIGRIRPDLAIIDISLQDGNGLSLIEQISRQYPEVRMLVLSMHDEVLYADRALQAGAMGYVNKEEASDKVINGIRQVLAGKLFVSERMSERLLGRATGRTKKAAAPAVEHLSNRELEVFEMLGRGKTTREIADNLQLSVKTIESHHENIKRKLLLKNAQELLRRAVEWVLQKG